MIILPRSLKAVLLTGVVSLSLAVTTANAADTTAVAAAPSAPAAPPIALSVPAIEAASAFRAFEQRAAAISPAFTTGIGVEDSLAIGSAYEPKQLARGAIAYGALIALQDPTFVATLRVYAPFPTQRKALADRIVQDPIYASAFAGAPSAAGLIVATMAAQNSKISTVGAAVKQSAYSVQHSAWSKLRVTDPAGRLAKAKAQSAALMNAAPDDVAELQRAQPVDGAPSAPALGAHGQPVAGPYAPVVTRALAVAALAILGEGGDDNDPQVEALLTEPSGGQCLNMAKLDLYQCLAVAGPWYEDIFCLGEHALGETSQCISKETATAAQTQAAVTPVSMATPAATAQSAQAPMGAAIGAQTTAMTTPTAMAAAH